MLKEKIKALCKQKGVTIRQFERDCGLGHATMMKWDKSAPTITSLKKVSDYFNISICELIEEYDE